MKYKIIYDEFRGFKRPKGITFDVESSGREIVLKDIDKLPEDITVKLDQKKLPGNIRSYSISFSVTYDIDDRDIFGCLPQIKNIINQHFSGIEGHSDALLDEFGKIKTEREKSTKNYNEYADGIQVIQKYIVSSRKASYDLYGMVGRFIMDDKNIPDASLEDLRKKARAAIPDIETALDLINQLNKKIPPDNLFLQDWLRERKDELNTLLQRYKKLEREDIYSFLINEQCDSILSSIGHLDPQQVDRAKKHIIDLKGDLSKNNEGQQRQLYPYLDKFRQIINDLLKKNLLDTNTFDQVFLLYKKPQPEKDRTVNSILALSRLDLLTHTNFHHLLNGTFSDKSCSARIEVTGYSFFGDVSKDQYGNKVMWSHYSSAIEEKIAAFLQQNMPLTDIYEYVRTLRNRIAITRSEGYEFGSIRNSDATDTYSNAEKITVANVANVKIFPALCEMLITQLPDLEQVKKEMAQNNISELSKPFSCQLESPASQGNVPLPEETIMVTFNRNKDGNVEISKIENTFAVERNHYDRFQSTLAYYDETMLTKIKTKEYDFNKNNDDEFLRDLGKMAFYLTRSYPLSRGSGSVNQWIIRGIVRDYTEGRLDLGDIRLGNNAEKDKNVPYDIYAQVTQNPDVYAEAFRKALLPEFRAIREMAAFQEPMRKSKIE